MGIILTNSYKVIVIKDIKVTLQGNYISKFREAISANYTLMTPMSSGSATTWDENELD